MTLFKYILELNIVNIVRTSDLLKNTGVTDDHTFCP